MRLRVKLVGSGTKDDPFRPGLPTCGLVDVDYQAGWCDVVVPDEDVPPVALDADAGGLDQATWHEHLDRRYEELAGRFRPELYRE